MSYYLEMSWLVETLGRDHLQGFGFFDPGLQPVETHDSIQNERYIYTLASLLKRKGSLSSPYCLVKKQMHHFLHVCVSDVVAARFGVLWAFIILVFADAMGSKWPRLLFLLIFCGFFFPVLWLQLLIWAALTHHETPHLGLSSPILIARWCSVSCAFWFSLGGSLRFCSRTNAL